VERRQDPVAVRVRQPQQEAVGRPVVAEDLLFVVEVLIAPEVQEFSGPPGLGLGFAAVWTLL
jgi:hypothetical protein